MSYAVKGLGLNPSQYPPIPPSMAFTVTETWALFQSKSFNVNSAQALSDYVVFVNQNIDSSVKTSQDGIYRAQNNGSIDSAIASQWIDFIANPSKYAGTTAPPATGTKINAATVAEIGLAVVGLVFVSWVLFRHPKAVAAVNPRKHGGK